MTDITVKEIQEVYGEKEPSLDRPKKQSLRTIAEDLTDTVFAGKMARIPEIEASTEHFAKYLGAHLWQLAEGQSLNEAFQTGNTDVRSTIVSDPRSSLSQTVYGQTCLLMLRGGASTSIVRTDI